MRDTQYLKEYTDTELIKIRDDAKRLTFNGKLISKVSPYIHIIKDINSELLERLNRQQTRMRVK